jgi:hypothetical protein
MDLLRPRSMQQVVFVDVDRLHRQVSRWRALLDGGGGGGIHGTISRRRYCSPRVGQCHVTVLIWVQEDAPNPQNDQDLLCAVAADPRQHLHQIASRHACHCTSLGNHVSSPESLQQPIGIVSSNWMNAVSLWQISCRTWRIFLCRLLDMPGSAGRS